MRFRRRGGHTHGLHRSRARGGRSVMAVLAVVSLTLSGCSEAMFSAVVPRPVPAKARLDNSHGVHAHKRDSGGDTAAHRQALSDSRRTRAESYWTTSHIAQMFADSPTVNPPDAVDLRDLSPGTGFNFTGVPYVGTFFYRDTPGRDHSCTGVVVDSPMKNVVLSAAHCWEDADPDSIIFVPEFSMKGDRPQMPFGIWTLGTEKIGIDERYNEGDMAYDVAAMAMAPNQKGQMIGELTGTVSLAVDAPRNQPDVAIVGYPSAVPLPGDPWKRGLARACHNFTTSYLEDGTDYFSIDCEGMPTGISGSPWLIENPNPTTPDDDLGSRIDPSTLISSKSVEIVALTGGGQGGGGYTNDTSIGVPIEDFVFELIASVSDFDPVSTTDWNDANAFVYGNFSNVSDREDFLVLWNNGEMSVYFPSGDLKKPFLGVRKIARPNARFAFARSIATGDFDGSGYTDILHLGTDGTVTLIQDPIQFGSRQTVVLSRGDPLTWLHARAFSGGIFTPHALASGVASDLVTLWDDGSLTLTPHINTTGLSDFIPLAPAGTFSPDASVRAYNMCGSGYTDVVVMEPTKTTVLWDVHADDDAGARQGHGKHAGFGSAGGSGAHHKRATYTARSLLPPLPEGASFTLGHPTDDGLTAAIRRSDGSLIFHNVSLPCPSQSMKR